MNRQQVLIDSSFLYILFSKTDELHDRARQAVRDSSFMSIIPGIVLTEVAFLFNRAGGPPAVAEFLLSFVVAGARPVAVELTDLSRASEIITLYSSSRLDFVDCCLMAMSERLNITHVATFDHRDFGIFRPRHCDYLELLP